MARTNYNGKMAELYDRGRYLLPEAVESWRLAVQPHIRPIGGAVLDLGSGTGRFSVHLADWFHTTAIGVEPAEGMRREALKSEADPRVALAGGEAERIPLGDDVCCAAWLSNVIHHFRDLDAVARELRRVIRRAGPVFVRGTFPDRPIELVLFRHFPETALVANKFPTFDATVRSFSSAGFESVQVTRVTQIIARSTRDFVEKVRTRADTTLAGISDEAFARGLAELEVEASVEADPRPVTDALDLVVFE